MKPGYNIMSTGRRETRGGSSLVNEYTISEIWLWPSDDKVLHPEPVYDVRAEWAFRPKITSGLVGPKIEIRAALSVGLQYYYYPSRYVRGTGTSYYKLQEFTRPSVYLSLNEK